MRRARDLPPPLTVVLRRLLLVSGLLLSATATLSAQSREEMLRLYPWIDTTGESSVYPVGDAVGVYRAALDLLYNDNGKRPAVLVMHDTAEPGGDRPCPIACDRPWIHKSKMDPSTILGFARLSPKRPRIREFGYPVPIVFVSYDDVQRMEYDGREYMAAHNIHSDLNRIGLRYELMQRFPGAWGLTELTKVGFNKDHTEALVQIRHWCGESCASTETLFLKRYRSDWRVIERIPHYAEAGPTGGNLRYRGPSGDSPEQSEIIAADTKAVARSESVDAAAVYRLVLDSLYNFQGESPSRIVVTDRVYLFDGKVPAPKTPLDSGLLQKYLFLRTAHIARDVRFESRLPVSVVLSDSLARLDKIGAAIADFGLSNASLWFGLAKVFPGIWGIVGLSPIAFNLAHTQAMVYSSHQCGESCNSSDTWVLVRRGDRWRIAERIGHAGYKYWEPSLFPLRYIGFDLPPNSYRHRRVRFVFLNAVTNQPLAHYILAAQGDSLRSSTFVTDDAGRVDLGTISFLGSASFTAGCPDEPGREGVSAGQVIFSPGLDTTVESRVNFRPCLHRAIPRQLTGAAAFISKNEARFVFPLKPVQQTLNRPEIRNAPGITSFWWEVEWTRIPPRDRPFMLALPAATNASDPIPPSLPTVIGRAQVEAMIDCYSCSESVMYADPDVTAKQAFATVEGDQLVIHVKGEATVNRMFAAVPRIVTLAARVRHKPDGKRELDDIVQSQAVLVNCQASDSTGYSRRRCNAPTNAQFANPPIDSIGPRRVNVVAITYDGGSLAKDIDVLIRSEDKKLPDVVHSTGSSGKISLLQPSGDSVSFHAFCPSTPARKTVSGDLALYLAAGRDTTVQLVVDPRRCAH